MSKREAKLQQLADIEGLPTLEALLEEFVWDDVVPGICMNSGCKYTTQVEPDCRGGWCEACRANSVTSCLVLGGVI